MASSQIWTISLISVIAVLGLDLIWAILRRNKETTLREAAAWTFIYVSAAIVFGFSMQSWGTEQASKEFFAGWITEYSLSIDNLFIFLIILSRLQIAKKQEQLVLLFGITLALIFRGIFIAIGAAVISRYVAVFFLFGAILLYTAWTLIKEEPGENEWQEGRILTFLRNKGLSNFTLALFALGMTDLIFALDSIPAIFGLTRDPYIVFMANAFALMGLRQLYFLVGILLKRLVYLSKGLSIILAFIGFKLFIEAFHGVGIHEIAGIHLTKPSLNVSLGVIIASLAVTTVISLAKRPKLAD
ncbi:MAG: TerC family protein [Actinobacteria bacterium]|jgi:tellurite resistance protein TerC|nr:TerC family protein [Actinomycetota bacterium]NCW34862.1 TerC family protein [Actinomycetota bacterium]NCZ73224.1 TerC family protein [Actinomycetota bacterium]NDA41313.1 TerC family protein [Actinomycetota bacterium]NDB31189.1 TerC family protein [Actinomycetota bacterium]